MRAEPPVYHGFPLRIAAAKSLFLLSPGYGLCARLHAQLGKEVPFLVLRRHTRADDADVTGGLGAGGAAKEELEQFRAEEAKQEFPPVEDRVVLKMMVRT
jgi:hypothetical protein